MKDFTRSQLEIMTEAFSDYAAKQKDSLDRESKVRFEVRGRIAARLKNEARQELERRGFTV